MKNLSREEQIAKLLLNLKKIEAELERTKEQLYYLKRHSNPQLVIKAEERIKSIEKLNQKIVKARLNLSYTFL